MPAEPTRQFYFTSDLFRIEPGEDEQTNPGRYGRQLAHWLRDKLIAAGQSVEGVIPEDWGWCVVCRSKPYRLWIGCGNMDEADTDEQPAATPPALTTWSCFIECHAPILRRLLGNNEADRASTDLCTLLHQILTAERRINLIEEP